MSDEIKRLNPEQIKIAMYLKLLEDINKNLKKCLFENKIKKKTLADLQAASQKSCYAIKQMSSKVKEGFLQDTELEVLDRIETEINYEIVIGKVKKKFRWEYTKELTEYINQLIERIMERTGLEKEEFYL